MEEYAAAKGRVHTHSRTVVHNLHEEWSARLADEHAPAGARRVAFGMDTPRPGELGIVEDLLVDRAFVADPATSADELGTLADVRPAGPHNVSNALAAAAGAAAAGASLQHIAAGLASMRAVRGRLQLKTARNGAWVIDDSYNANPSSVRAGIEVLAQLEGRRWLVLGDMGELGEFAPAAHAEAGLQARSLGVERLYTFGPLAALAAASFGEGARSFPDVDALARALDAEADREVRILIKGSRSNRLERVVEALVKEG
jgi:UDP-N-acetylmuramyl pentapeptide synthase